MADKALYTFERSDALMERARKVVPSGIYGHQSPALLTPGAYPSFLARGEGCRIWDVDGNEYKILKGIYSYKNIKSMLIELNDDPLKQSTIKWLKSIGLSPDNRFNKLKHHSRVRRAKENMGAFTPT